MGMPRTYNDGKPYYPARGHLAPKSSLELRKLTCHPVIRGKPSAEEFVVAIHREMKIRSYQPTTIRKYISAISRFLDWFGRRPNRVTLEVVRQFLELLVDSGAQSSTLVTYISAIRMSFDKFCGRSVTLGLATPRRRKRLPVVPSRDEIRRLIANTTGSRDRLLIELMYASGIRVSEVACLQWKHIDFDRSSIRVESGKGKVDREALFPITCAQKLLQLCELAGGRGYVFVSSESVDRHISPRTVERIVKQCSLNAGIAKNISPHSLRHAFATHLLEKGTDIKFVQKFLGHRKLETTAIYTRCAKISSNRITSPLDELSENRT